jgi:uncharacterized membrane protein
MRYLLNSVRDLLAENYLGIQFRFLLIYLNLCFKLSFEKIQPIYNSVSIGILHFIHLDFIIHNIL